MADVTTDDILSEFGLFHSLSVFSQYEMIDTVLDVSVHKGWEIVDCVADAVVGDAALWIVVGAYLGRTVAGRHHCLTF